MFKFYVAALTFFSIIILTGCSEKHDFKYAYIDDNLTIVNEENITPDTIEALKMRNLEYWEYSSAANYEKSFEYELPYLKFLHHKDWYVGFHESDKKKYRLTIVKIEFDDKESYLAHVVARLEYKDKLIELRHKWYNINGNWYHKYSPSYIPTID